MPRKRRVAKLTHRQLTWDDVDVSMHLDFTSGWHPPTNEFDRSRSSWQTWEAYLNDWAAVRGEALPELQAKRAEFLRGHRADVARRTQQLRESVTDSDRDLYGELLATAQGWLAEEEADAVPFAEEIYQAVLAGETPESAVWSRRERLDNAGAGETWDGSED